jgi:hypothetical protein
MEGILLAARQYFKFVNKPGNSLKGDINQPLPKCGVELV